MENPYQKIVLNLGAQIVNQKYYIAGNRLIYWEGNREIYVKLDQYDNQQFVLNKGDSILMPFTSLYIDTDRAYLSGETATLFVVNQYNLIPGEKRTNLQFDYSPLNLTIIDKDEFWGWSSKYNTAGVSVVQLWNPANSGKDLMLRSFRPTGDVTAGSYAMESWVGYSSTAASTVFGNIVNKNYDAGFASVAQLRTADVATGISGLIGGKYYQYISNSYYNANLGKIEFEPNLKIPPGYGWQTNCGPATRTLHVYAEWKEVVHT